MSFLEGGLEPGRPMECRHWRGRAKRNQTKHSSPANQEPFYATFTNQGQEIEAGSSFLVGFTSAPLYFRLK